jgi:alkylated DNA repair dioxygenase AlkB
MIQIPMPWHQSSAASELPSGFRYLPEFLSDEEQTKLLEVIQRLPLRPFEFQGYTAKRRIVEYGFEYDFRARKASTASPIPDYLVPLRNRAAVLIGEPPENIVEAVVTEYPPGAPIGWHRDVKQFETIVGISLASPCRFRLKPYRGAEETVTVVLDPGSAYVMSGDARWKYQHSIPPVKELRYSVTFRTLRRSKAKSAA